MIQDYRELVVWQKAMEVAKQIYLLVKKLPKEEIYALSDQMRRAAVSIPSNIAEGNARNSSKEYAQFLSIARGSKAELETQLLLCKEIGYLTQTEIQPLLVQLKEIGKMISVMIRKLQNVPESVVKEIAGRKPLRAVFRDSGFASSPEKINVFEIFKLYMPEDAGDISKRVRVI